MPLHSSQWVVGLSYNDLPPAVVDRAKGVTLHSLALRMLMRNHVLAATGRTARPLNAFELEPLICDLMTAHGGKKEVKKRMQAYEAAWARLQHDNPGFVQSPEDAAFAGRTLLNAVDERDKAGANEAQGGAS